MIRSNASNTAKVRQGHPIANDVLIHERIVQQLVRLARVVDLVLRGVRASVVQDRFLHLVIDSLSISEHMDQKVITLTR